ncbi:MAG: hypothetical protein ACD_19C00426G0116 [uncultured bacterium]|nr:MAG: hypothetical protein ACD_19C00426G0116 [uncultured bacterium]
MNKVKTSEWGLFGPFSPEDDLGELWHFAEEQSLEEQIEQAKITLKEVGLETDEGLKELEDEYKNLLLFVDNHTRLVERYKFDKKVLNQVEDDWHDYNLTLYGRWCRLQSFLLGGDSDVSVLRKAGKNDRIKLEEIEKRFHKLLD